MRWDRLAVLSNGRPLRFGSDRLEPHVCVCVQGKTMLGREAFYRPRLERPMNDQTWTMDGFRLPRVESTVLSRQHRDDAGLVTRRGLVVVDSDRGNGIAVVAIEVATPSTI